MDNSSLRAERSNPGLLAAETLDCHGLRLAMTLSELKYRDYDKFLACNYAPAPLKLALAALFTFHLDIADIPLEVSEPIIGQIKFQWWRDVIAEIMAGAPPRPHPVLLALKGHEAIYADLLPIIDKYETLLEGTPQQFEEVKQFLEETEAAILKTAAGILGVEYGRNLALAYAYSRTARKLRGKNEVFSGKLFEESANLLPSLKNSLFAAVTRYYNKNPTGSRTGLILRLVAGKYKLL